jgi:hypothetical protein
MATELYINEARILAYDLHNSTTKDMLALDSGYLEVMDRGSSSVTTAEFAVSVTGGRIYWLVSSANLTASAGTHDLWWRAVQGSEHFIFKTQLDVNARS